ncbi:MAG: sarcosine oxidase subunit gamma [Kiloniellales bacterium]
MVERYLSQGPLAHLHLAVRAAEAPERPGVTLAELAPRGLIDLRGDPDDDAFRAAAARVLGVALPVQPNTSAAGAGLPSPKRSSGFAQAGVTLFWLGPDEWLIAAPSERAAGLVAGLGEALQGRHHAVVDLSSARATIAVAGARARDVLAKGCPLDLHPRAFKPGDCAQSHYAKASVLLCQADDAPTYHLTVARSFAEYLWLRLEDAALEYGCAVAAG